MATIEEIATKIAIRHLAGNKRGLGVSRRWKIGVIRRIFPELAASVQDCRRRIIHVERQTHARCLRGQLFPVVVKEARKGFDRTTAGRPGDRATGRVDTPPGSRKFQPVTWLILLQQPKEHLRPAGSVHQTPRGPRIN